MPLHSQLHSRSRSRSRSLTTFFLTLLSLSLSLYPSPTLSAPASSSSASITCTPSKDYPGPLNPSFEDGTLNGWTIISGTAFSPASITTTSSFWGGPFNFAGKYHLWGFSAAGDDATGELHSSTFKASSALSFLIGGGYDPNNLYVALVRDSDNKVLLKQTGANDEAYVRVLWDTSAWSGTRVHLVVYDNKAGSWGHVNVDDIRVGCAALSDTLSSGSSGSSGSGGSASGTQLSFTTIGQSNQPSGSGSSGSSVSLSKKLAVDPLRPQFHYTPFSGWINDPAGLVQWKSRHHLFSQYNPAAAVWGPMHWSHADSVDGVHWRNLPVALYPAHVSDPTDNTGRFTGSAVTDPADGSMRLLFTEFTDTTHHPDATPETVWTAVSSDGKRFSYPGPAVNPVIPAPPAGAGNGFRDPKVFLDPNDNKYKMVVGSGDGDSGKIQLYVAGGNGNGGSQGNQLTNWTYAGVAYQSDGSRGAMFECPNLFPVKTLDGKTSKWALFYGGDSKNWYEIGTFDGSRFRSEKVGLLDYGPDFYAAQYYQEQTGTQRTLAIGWVGNWDQNARFVSRLNGWAGAQGITRELFLKADGGLGSRPIVQVASLASGGAAGGTSSTKDIAQGKSWSVGESNQGQFTVTFDLAASSASVVTVKVFAVGANPDDAVLVQFDKGSSTLTLDTTRASSYGWPGTWTAPVTVDASSTLSLTILMDRSLLEVFSGDGVSLTAWVWPKYVQSNSVQVVADGQGSVRVLSASLQPFGSGWVN